ncbi:MAG TPA: VCBS repeat-containing protein, partial [Mycobacteriales bacterium]|nr:VCBS repeat-containing protein [Mycobacteriales bacterium]
GNVQAFRWTDGRRIFAARAVDGVHIPGVFATPVAADLDRDGWQEIIVPSWDHWLHVWHARGGGNARGFPVFLKDTSWSSPAVADIDRDGWLDIVFGYDCDGAPGQPCHPARGGYLTAVRHDGRVKAGWPRFIRDQVVWSSPALVDLTGDGRLDVVVGTGSYPMAGGRSVYAFRSDGRPLWRTAVGGRTMSSPAVGDSPATDVPRSRSWRTTGSFTCCTATAGCATPNACPTRS